MIATTLENWLNTKSYNQDWRKIIPLIEEIPLDISLWEKGFVLNKTFEYCLNIFKFNETNITRNNYEKTKKDNIDLMNLMDNIFKKCGKKSFVLTNESIFKLETSNLGKIFLEKNNINFFKQEYREFKFDYICKEIISSYLSNQGIRGVANNFQESTQKIIDCYEKTKMNNTIWQKYISESTLYFYCAIEKGYQPSQKEILNAFTNLWHKTNNDRLEEFSYFCEAFSYTNVFIHTLSPSKNIQKSLKTFFNNVMETDNNIVRFSYSDRNFPSYLEKEKLFILNPLFSYKNIEEKITRKNALRHLGKINISKEERVELKEIVAQHKTPTSKKIKI
jgi:hypothetical protein